MTILICGSSYTSGVGLEDCNLVWPLIFQNLSGYQVINTAVAGSSVDHVCYTVVKEVSAHNYKNVIITWPPLGRNLMVRNENNFLVNGNPTFHHTLYGNTKEFKEFLKLFYKYWSNELYDIKFTLQKILLVQNFLENKNCKYVFLNTNSYGLEYWTSLSTLPAEIKNNMLSAFNCMNDSQILDEENEIKNYVNQLSQSYYNPLSYNLENDCYNKNLIDSITKHPSASGHRYIAELIWQIWNNTQHTN